MSEETVRHALAYNINVFRFNDHLEAFSLYDLALVIQPAGTAQWDLDLCGPASAFHTWSCRCSHTLRWPTNGVILGPHAASFALRMTVSIRPRSRL
jgi:hypothetical protein